jgi:hypothetical protein
MIKICLPVILIFSLLSFVSCSNGSKNDFAGDEDSLKNLAEKKYNETQWAKELEGDRLLKDISKLETVEKNIRLTPQIFLNTSYSKNLETIYPYLDGFASLNLSNFNASIKEAAVKFCEGLCKNQFEESLFFKDDIYEFALFIKDIKANWKTVFDEPYPEAEGEKDGQVLFQEYYIGEPFDLNTTYEVPLRFVREKKGFLDVMLYFSKKKDEWKIEQLKVIKMEGTDGK